MTAADIVRAVGLGPATLDALAARTGGDRESLVWALEDARQRGWVSGGDVADCGPDGLCASAAPPLYTLTEAGRRALAATRSR